MRKKALVVTNLLGFVGFLWGDIRTLQSLGYEVTFVAEGDLSKNQESQKEFQSIGVRYIPVQMSSKNPLAKQNLQAYKDIKRILGQDRFDLVHCHTPIAGFITRLAARKDRKNGTKVFYTTHGFAFTRYSSAKQWLVYFSIEKFASRFCDAIITINDEDYENAQKMCCSNVRKINGVGVDTARYHDIAVDVVEYREKLGLPTDKIMILSVGELSERKNHQIIIKALGELPAKSDYIYVICGKEVGNSGIAARLKQLAQENGVELYLLGHRNDIPQIMRCSDIGAIPSVREGLGFAGIESLCVEVPLVGTRVQGIKEYIIDGVNGYLCDPFDAHGYAKAISKLSDEQHRRELKNNCYSVAQKFDISVSRSQMMEIYTTLLL